MRLLIHSAQHVVLVTDQRDLVLAGNHMKSIRVLSDESGLAIAVDENGLIADIGTNADIMKKWNETIFENIFDASGMCILPGFVDAHTHPVWDGDRVQEFIMKLEGASYLEIHQRGGGIYSTVNSTNNCPDDILLSSLENRLMKMLEAGTTVAECKSGYGLETDAEFRLLHLLQKAKHELPIDISITYCGAHAIPRGKTADMAVQMIVEEQIPKIKKLNEEKILSVENIDVFCEKGVFDIHQSKKILEAGKSIGLRINFHGDELNALGSAEMGAEVNATAISHLEEISKSGISAMKKSGTIAVILPTTAFFMHLRPPPVRELISQGIPVALGTDFNPNAYCLSMPLIMHLACVTMGMTIPEALAAATLNAAASIGRSTTNGSIEIGKCGDFVVLDAPRNYVLSFRWEHIIYQYGAHGQLIYAVIKLGRVVYKKTTKNKMQL